MWLHVYSMFVIVRKSSYVLETIFKVVCEAQRGGGEPVVVIHHSYLLIRLLMQMYSRVMQTQVKYGGRIHCRFSLLHYCDTAVQIFHF